MNARPWLNVYDPEVPHFLTYPDFPLHQFLQEAAKKYPQHACTIFKGGRISYRKMDRITDRLAAGLASLGVSKGDRVGIFMPNIPQYIMAFFAILKAGGVITAINPLSSLREIEQQLNDLSVKTLFITSKDYQMFKSVQPATSLQNLIVTSLKDFLPAPVRLLLGLTGKELLGPNNDIHWRDTWMQDLIDKHTSIEKPAPEIGPDDPAVFQYTGGTTGVPKAAVILHRNLVANTFQLRSWYVTAEPGRETWLMAIPLCLVYGMVAGICLGVSLAASLVMVPDPRDLEDVLSCIEIYQVTFFPGVPTHYNALIKHPNVQAGKVNLSSIKTCISASAPLMPETRTEFERLTGIRLVEGYGLSEAPTATHCNPLQGKGQDGSIGLPLPDVDAKIVSLDDETTPLPAGEVGELVVSGPQVMAGYFLMEAETSESLRNGWLHTGEIGRMDERGFFYVLDRKYELIKPAGFQVFPREVEEVVIANSKVREVAVAGVPDAYRGETVKAWIVLKSGEQADAEEIRHWCRKRLAKYKVPSLIEFRKELPKTPIAGKLLRHELVRQHLEMIARGEHPDISQGTRPIGRGKVTVCRFRKYLPDRLEEPLEDGPA